MSYPKMTRPDLQIEDVPKHVRNSTEPLRLSASHMARAYFSSAYDLGAATKPNTRNANARDIAVWIGKQVTKAFMDEYLRQRGETGQPSAAGQASTDQPLPGDDQVR